MNKLYVLPCRCQPLHNGHVDMITQVVKKMIDGDKLLILIGSSNKTRSLANPFTYEEREGMVVDTINNLFDIDFEVMPLKDYDYDLERWENQLHGIIDNRSVGLDPVLVCGDKDNDKELRVSWGRGLPILAVKPYPIHTESVLSATIVRKLLARGFNKAASNVIPEEVGKYLTKAVDFLISETAIVNSYKDSWKHSPFPPLFTATDAVVRDGNGDFLLIQRGGEMGTGDLALAGGFLEEQLSYEDNMKKELLEEANLNLDEEEHNIITSWLCDHPSRAYRGRMTTMAFLVQLPKPFSEYPEIKAGDDAAEVEFKTLEELDNMSLFNDHYGLILKLLKLEGMGVPYVKNS